jgi:hypothetical protein
MNRLIKFRGRAIDTKEWIYGSLEIWPGGYHRILFETYTGLANSKQVDTATVGQFTGFHAYDQELYEGDIIQDSGGNKGTVLWSDRGFYVDFGEDIDYQPIADLKPDNADDENKIDYLIVGNTHGNSDGINVISNKAIAIKCNGCGQIYFVHSGGEDPVEGSDLATIKEAIFLGEKLCLVDKDTKPGACRCGSTCAESIEG